MYFHCEVFRKGGYIRLKRHNYLHTIFVCTIVKKLSVTKWLFTTCNNCKSKLQLTTVTNKIRVKTTTVRSSNMSYLFRWHWSDNDAKNRQVRPECTISPRDLRMSIYSCSCLTKTTRRVGVDKEHWRTGLQFSRFLSWVPRFCLLRWSFSCC